MGSHTPVTLAHLCPITKSGVPNLKSNAVLALGKTLYSEAHMITEARFRGFQNDASNLGLRCVLHPSTLRRVLGAKNVSNPECKSFTPI